MSTTTSEDGVQSTQPTTDEAGNDDAGVAIVQDEHGSPKLESENISALGQASEDVQNEASETSTDESQPEAAEETAQAESTETDQEIVEWAAKKGLEINPENPNEVRLARMQLENDRRFHESRQESPKPPKELELTDDPSVNQVIERQNLNDLRTYVRDWFDANPEMKNHRDELTKIAQERPWLQDMDDIKAHFLSDPNRLEQVQKAGGRKALENLAQKQAQVPPKAGASNPQAYESNQISPQNVYDLVEKNDQAWFEKNYEAISKAMQG